MARLTLRHEDLLNIAKQDTSFMILMSNSDPGVVPMLLQLSEKWKKEKLRSQVTVTNPLRLILFAAMIEEFTNRVRCLEKTEGNPAWDKAREMGIVTADKSFCYRGWDPDQTKLVPLDSPPLTLAAALTALRTIQTNLAPGIVHRFHATRPLSSKMQGPTTPFMLEVGLRHQNSSIIYNAEPKCSDGVYRYDNETKHTGQITVSSGSSDYPQQTGEEVDGFLPVDCVWGCCLSNPGNHCYIIASVIALAHVYLSTSLLQMPRATMGDLGRGIVQLLQKQPRYILDLPIWKTLLENWPEIDRQQDAPELLTYLLLRVPRSEVGEWQARLQLAEQQACDLVDHGHNIQPIRLVCAEVRMNSGISLQSCINAWCYDQGARHGFLHPPPAWLFFQLERFAVDSLSGLVHKTSWRCHITTEPVSVPFFRSEQGLELENEFYMVFALVLHHDMVLQFRMDAILRYFVKTTSGGIKMIIIKRPWLTV